MTSSKYIKHVSNLSPEKITAINRSKVLGYYVRPKGTTIHSYSPALVTKAALPLLPGSTSVSVWNLIRLVLPRSYSDREDTSLCRYNISATAWRSSSTNCFDLRFERIWWRFLNLVYTPVYFVTCTFRAIRGLIGNLQPCYTGHWFSHSYNSLCTHNSRFVLCVENSHRNKACSSRRH